MTIKRIMNISDVLPLVPIEVKLREKEKSEVALKDVLTFVKMQLESNPYFSLWMVEENDTVLGYVGLLATVIGHIRNIHIWRIWHDPHRPDAMKTLEEIISYCAKQVKATTILIEVPRGVRAYERRWGFKPVRTVMERRV